jgi:hypothetical protein
LSLKVKLWNLLVLIWKEKLTTLNSWYKCPYEISKEIMIEISCH